MNKPNRAVKLIALPDSHTKLTRGSGIDACTSEHGYTASGWKCPKQIE